MMAHTKWPFYELTIGIESVDFDNLVVREVEVLRLIGPDRAVIRYDGIIYGCDTNHLFDAPDLKQEINSGLLPEDHEAYPVKRVRDVLTAPVIEVETRPGHWYGGEDLFGPIDDDKTYIRPKDPNQEYDYVHDPRIRFCRIATHSDVCGYATFDFVPFAIFNSGEHSASVMVLDVEIYRAARDYVEKLYGDEEDFGFCTVALDDNVEELGIRIDYSRLRRENGQAVPSED